MWSCLPLTILLAVILETREEVDTGGWITSKESLLASPGDCNIEVREASDLTQREFLNRYAYEQPVVIRGATDNSVFKNQCRKESMMSQHASKRIKLSSANTHSYDKYSPQRLVVNLGPFFCYTYAAGVQQFMTDVTLEHYVTKVMKPQTLEKLGNGLLGYLQIRKIYFSGTPIRKETFYWFGDNNFTEWQDLITLYKPPPYSLPHMTGAYSFGLAAAGTGVPFHFHGPGFGEVIFGQKRWFMYPPNKMPHFHPNRTTLQWFYEDYPELHPLDLPLDCTIGPGDIIYFPDRWWHATLNIDTSVFISTFLS